MTRVKEFWEAHFLPLEFLVSILTMAGFIIWGEFYAGRGVMDSLLEGNRSAVYGALSAIFGALLGFVITAVSIVLGYVASDKLTLVRESPHYEDLWRVYKAAMRSLAVATIAGLLGLIFDREARPMPFLFYLNILTTTLAFFRLGRSIWVLENIISLVTQKDEN
ncbi:MAG: hypothetical protein HY864_18370 [Chloroflexi bacterium]|nr:hypothetical protein [Chloroflexota bacterium]